MPVYPPHGPETEVVEQELEATQRFSDPISKVAWNNMAYSPDGDWLAGGMLRLNLLMWRLITATRRKALPILLLTKFISGTSPPTDSLQQPLTEGVNPFWT